jgi:bacterioferritin-associated ferredoxin
VREAAVIVCHCRAVSDREIREAVRAGAADCQQVARACHAGHTCGGCRPAIHDILESERAACRCAAETLAASAR